MDDALQFISGADLVSPGTCDHCGEATCQHAIEQTPSEETIPLGLEDLNTGEKLVDDEDLAF